MIYVAICTLGMHWLKHKKLHSNEIRKQDLVGGVLTMRASLRKISIIYNSNQIAQTKLDIARSNVFGFALNDLDVD